MSDPGIYHLATNRHSHPQPTSLNSFKLFQIYTPYVPHLSVLSMTARHLEKPCFEGNMTSTYILLEYIVLLYWLVFERLLKTFFPFKLDGFERKRALFQIFSC